MLERDHVALKLHTKAGSIVKPLTILFTLHIMSIPNAVNMTTSASLIYKKRAIRAPTDTFLVFF